MTPKIARVLSVLIAALVHASTAVLVGAVVAYLVWVWPSIPGVAIGVMFGAIVAFIIPRPTRLPPDSLVVQRSNCPSTFRLVDTIAKEVDSPRIDILAFNGQFNAITSRVGIRRRRALIIGLPLWEALGAAERFALLGHETGHEANGDPRRGTFVGQSLDTLGDWHNLIHPGPWARFSEPSEPGLHGVANQLAWVVQRVAVLPIACLYKAQLRATLIDHRNAELAADRSSELVAGTIAVNSLLHTTLYATSIDLALRRAVRTESDLWEAIRSSIHNLSNDAKRSYLHAAGEEQLSVDDTHPPTVDRLAALSDHADQTTPTVVLDRLWQQDSDAELEDVRREIEHRIRDSLDPFHH